VKKVARKGRDRTDSDAVVTFLVALVLFPLFFGLLPIPHFCYQGTSPARAFAGKAHVAEFEITESKIRDRWWNGSGLSFYHPTWKARPVRVWKGQPSRVVTIHGPFGNHRPPVLRPYRFVLASDNPSHFHMWKCSPYVKDTAGVERALGPGRVYDGRPVGASWMGSPKARPSAGSSWIRR
jgi:hypothetical protein